MRNPRRLRTLRVIEVDNLFKDFDKPNSPGCAVAVIKDGSIIYKRGYGMADLDHSIAITPTTVFHAASLAKQFTAMSIMLLVQQKKLSLDDEVTKYVRQLQVGKRITIADMLSHVSGIREQFVLLTMAGWRLYDDLVTREDVIDLVSRMKSLDFDPRKDLIYSNTGYTLAGLIVEKVTGQSLSDFARDNIFKPLGMNDTVIVEKHGQIVHNRAYGYSEQPFELWMPNLDVAGATNLLTTVEDLARWDRNFEDKTVGGDTVLSQMQTPAELSDGTLAKLGTDGFGNVVHYGLGLQITKFFSVDVVEHDGRNAGYRSHLIRFPDKRFAVACLCNLALPDDHLRHLARRIAFIYLTDRFAAPPPSEYPADFVSVDPTPPAPLTPVDVTEYTGSYYSKEIGTTYQIVLKASSSLAIVRHKYPATDLTRALPDTFTIKGFSRPLTTATVRFTRNRQQTIDGFFLAATVTANPASRTSASPNNNRDNRAPPAIGSMVAGFTDMGSFRLGARRLDDPAPFVGFLRNDPCEIGRRAGKHCPAHVGKSRSHPGIGKDRIGFCVQYVNDVGRRVPGSANAIS